MSLVDRAGSVSEISPSHSFLRKNFDAFIREAGLVRLSRSLKIFPYEHSSPDNRDERF